MMVPIVSGYYPSGSQVLNSTHSTSVDFYQSRGGVRNEAIYLHHRNGTGGDDGIYSCQIPNLDGNLMTLYVGIYAVNTCMYSD